MPENITGGILSAETESMTFSPFGVKVRHVGALSNPRINRRVFSLVLCTRGISNAAMKAGIFLTAATCSIYYKGVFDCWIFSALCNYLSVILKQICNFVQEIIKVLCCASWFLIKRPGNGSAALTNQSQSASKS